MTPEILAELSGLVNVLVTKQLVVWIGILVGFYCMFRKSNLVPCSGVKFDPTQQLCRDNFTRMKDCYLATVYWSKTIQYHDCALDIPLLENPDKRICPVFWLDYYFSVVPAHSFNAALCYYKGRNLCNLNYTQFTEQMCTWLEVLGYWKEVFSSHSLRRGRAQWAATSGISGHIIKLLGDWKSECYHWYLDMSLQARYDAMVLFNTKMF